MKIETLDRAMMLIEAMRYPGAVERIACAFEYFPELRDETHTKIAKTLGLARETVCKSMPKVWKLMEKGEAK